MSNKEAENKNKTVAVWPETFDKIAYGVYKTKKPKSQISDEAIDLWLKENKIQMENKTKK